MRPAWRPFPRAISLPQHRRSIADARPFRAGDHILLRATRDRNATPLLRGPLTPGKRIDTHKGVLHHDDIIGKRVRDVVRTAPLKSGKDGFDFRVHDVKLEEYARMSRRLVTPIYPWDAGLIVSLLDLHPEVYDPQMDAESEPRLEILEAGTGHGALTLYLSRAIHAANPPKADLDLEAWKSRRRAVIHTIDIAHQYSSHAQSTIAAFRQGMYSGNIDFHTGNVRDWLARALPERDNEPFLSHAFLDLPGSDGHMAKVAEALRCDGTLVVFNPSITQIMDCAKVVKKEGIPLELETVVELGVNGGSGGREWDVRPVKPRAATKNQEEAEDSGLEVDEDGVRDPISDAAKDQGEWAMVCRPKVGERVVGGGFLGVWKKQRDMRS